MRRIVSRELSLTSLADRQPIGCADEEEWYARIDISWTSGARVYLVGLQVIL